MSRLRGAMFFLSMSLIVLSVQGKVASFITPCRIEDNECILASAREVLPVIAKGIPDLGIPPADPLRLDDVFTENGGLKIRFRNMEVKGPGQCKFMEIKRNDYFHAKLVIELPITVTGLYTMIGDLLQIPVEGDSDFEIKTDNVRITVDITLKVIKGKDDEDHYKVAKFDYKYEPVEEFHIHFNNLFDGDKKKAEPVEQVIKASGNDLVASLGKPVIIEIIKKAIGIIDSLLLAFPCKELEIR